MKKNLYAMAIIVLLVAACGGGGSPEPTATQPAPTSPPSATPLPPEGTQTPVPPSPTATREPPTATPTSAPPTETAKPPTPTIAPTAPPTATAAQPLTGSGGGLIAFVSTRSGNHQLYVMNADGSDQRRLTHSADSDAVPDWSPDGSQIAFHAHHGPDVWAIEVIDADGTNRQQLTGGTARDAGPVWSPDGTQIAFASDRSGAWEVFLMNADGTGLRQLTDDGAEISGIDWSPDGSRLVFCSDVDGDSDIYIIDVAGANRQQLTNDDTEDWWPKWSADGAQIAYASKRYGDFDIFVMDASGSNPRRLTRDRAADMQPAWSPDGTRIAFHSDRDGDEEVYVMSSDGSDVVQLTDNRAMDWGAAWAPVPASAVTGATFFKTYGSPGDDTADALLLAPDGGLYIAGATNLQFDGERQGDAYLIRTDPSGNVLWEKVYESSGYSGAQSIAWTGDGGLLLSGVTGSADTGSMDIFFTKLDAEGNQLWSRTYGGPLDEFGAAFPAEDGGYLIGGNLVDPNDTVVDNPGAAGYGGFAGRSNALVARVDGEGSELWARVLGGEENVMATGAAPTQDGGFLILSTVLRYPVNDDDILLIKVDQDGNEVWKHTWEDERSTGRGMIPTSDGNYLLTGVFSEVGISEPPPYDFLFIKVDPDGNQLWRSTFGDPDTIDYASVLAEAPDGGYVAVGNRVTDLYSWAEDLILIKIDGDGQLVWEKTVETKGHNMFGAMLPYPGGGYVVAGSTHRGNGFDIFVLKVDAEGNWTD